MTPSAVLDSSVAIDLYRGGLLEVFFQLPHAYMVPRNLYTDELEDWFGPTLLEKGLMLCDLEPAEMEHVQEFMRRCPSLSFHDACALALAAKGKYTLLAGAKDMRQLGEEIELEVRGVLHLFDMFEVAKLLSMASLHTCLTLVYRHGRSRLPADEVDARFQRYSTWHDAAHNT